MVGGKTAITPTRQENYSEWYQEVVKAAGMAENSSVRGCMVIKPWGYAIWENIQRALDDMFKATGHENAYFPLFIPLSYFEKEAEHVDGFAKECAVVTHHRLKEVDGKLIPDGELETPLVVRPTSETIIGDTYAKWVESYRDLPILINQWANVVRWEMRTRMFLRTAEFLWQEGHTAHETEREAIEETLQMLRVYEKFASEYLAMPVITGRKSQGERFPGAVETYSIEAMMQDRKALQSGTSHFLGQNFAKSSGIKYQSRTGTEEYAWTTSWGVSTRLIGGMIMIHADDNGLVVPPKLAPQHIVLLPIIRKDEDFADVMRYCEELSKELNEVMFDGRPIRVTVDRRDINAGEKSWSWVKKGIPLIAEIGKREIEEKTVFLGRRDKARNERYAISKSELLATISDILVDIQDNLYNRALMYMEDNSRVITDHNEFYKFFTPESKTQPEIHGGFVYSYWCGSEECESSINDDLSVSIRNIPFDAEEHGTGKCICCGKEAITRVLFAKSY